MDGAHPYAPIASFVKFTLLEVERGNLKASGLPGAEHYNPYDVVHGGFAGTLLDLALGHVSSTMIEGDGTGLTTTDLTIKYVRPMTTQSGTVFCDAKVIHAGKRIIMAEAQLRDGTGRLLATAQSTCLVLH